MDKNMATTERSLSSRSSSESSSKGGKSALKGSKPTEQKRIDVSHSNETSLAEFELEKRRSEKKRDIRTKQLNRYAMSMYGSPLEKEALRREQREVLLKQIRQKEESSKLTLREKVKESETAVAFDKECIDKDRHDQMKKASYLTQFRDGNKQLIETRAMQRRQQREEENFKERELLKQNPLNWSNTLS